MLTDQKLVYECPTCGMTYDRAGTCNMGCGELVAMNVDYICPADNQPVDQAGKCPRCRMDAKIVKTRATAMASPESASAATP